MHKAQDLPEHRLSTADPWIVRAVTTHPFRSEAFSNGFKAEGFPAALNPLPLMDFIGTQLTLF
jgi:hypothetical protein